MTQQEVISLSSVESDPQPKLVTDTRATNEVRVVTFKRAIQKWNALPPGLEVGHPSREGLADHIGELASRPLKRAVMAATGFMARSEAFDSDDLHQEGLAGIFKALPDYNPGNSSPNSYCLMIARRRIIDYVGSRQNLGYSYERRTVSLNKPLRSDEDQTQTKEGAIDLLVADNTTADEWLNTQEKDPVHRELASQVVDIINQPGLLSLFETEVVAALLEYYRDADSNYPVVQLTALADRLGVTPKAVENARLRAFNKVKSHNLTPVLEQLIRELND